MAAAEPVRQTIAPRLPRLALRRAAGIDMAGIAILAAVSVIAVTAPLIAPHGSNTTLALGPFHGPTAGAPMGTDDLGRDILSRVILGVRASWLSSIVVIASGVFIGGSIG